MANPPLEASRRLPLCGVASIGSVVRSEPSIVGCSCPGCRVCSHGFKAAIPDHFGIQASVSCVIYLHVRDVSQLSI